MSAQGFSPSGAARSKLNRTMQLTVTVSIGNYPVNTDLDERKRKRLRQHDTLLLVHTMTS